MIPRHPPHPWLGKQKLPRGKQNKKHLFDDDFHAFYKDHQSHITWSQNVPKMVPK